MTTPLNDITYQADPLLHIVALTGLAGSGKDTVADMLATHCGFTKLAFADPLRNEVAQAYNLGSNYDLLTNRDTKEEPTARLALCECSSFAFLGAVAMATGATVDAAWMQAPRSPRQVLQWWGTEYRRAERVNYWSTAMVLRIKDLANMGQRRFVITDCRFENEAGAVRRLGGMVWQVLRPEAYVQAVEGTHASVTDGFHLKPDLEVRNDGTVNRLRQNVLGAWWAQEANLPGVRVEIEA